MLTPKKNITKKKNMTKNKKKYIAILFMLILVSWGYHLFYNDAFTGYEAQGYHIYLSASTVKFVNNWLREGPVNLNFTMYEHPDSVEFNSINERFAYISYPSGAVIPPYVLARLLNKDEIQIGFIKQFLRLKFLFDTLLVCLIIYSIFMITLRLRQNTAAIVLSVILALVWMNFPVNLYYLRNVYFSDHCIISVVLLFVLLEINKKLFSKNQFTGFLFICLKFALALFGVLTDWYFLFVLFVSWLVIIIPLIKQKTNFLKIVSASLVYVPPVILGLGLFVLQVIQIPDYRNILMDKFLLRSFTGHNHGLPGNNLYRNVVNFRDAYSLLGIFIFIFPVLCIFAKIFRKRIFPKKYDRLFNLIMIVYLPPVLHILIFQNHSVVHDFSLLKFALPVLISLILLPVFILDYKKSLYSSIMIKLEQHKKLRTIKIPVFCLIIIALSISYTFSIHKRGYIQYRIRTPVSYEKEYLIRSNYSFYDVYFSFTESIVANPPEYLAISNKLIYKIDSIDEISQRFPNLRDDARILLMVNRDDSEKTEQILNRERDAIQNADLLFSSNNYDVWALKPL